jgi:hypothetical protein
MAVPLYKLDIDSETLRRLTDRKIEDVDELRQYTQEALALTFGWKLVDDVDRALWDFGLDGLEREHPTGVNQRALREVDERGYPIEG